MSSELITSIQNTDHARSQGVQTAISAQEPKQPQETKPLRQVEGNAPVQRQTPAAGGQDLPSQKAGQADERTPVEEVESAVSQISDFVQNFQRDLLFSIDKDSDQLVVKVVDSETQEVIRQIPSEEMLRIAKNLESSDSLILREQA